MKKKRVILLSVMIPVLALAALVGGKQEKQSKWDKQVQKILSFVYSDEGFTYNILNFQTQIKTQDEYEKEAIIYDIDGDGKKEILLVTDTMANMPGFEIYAFDPEMKEKPYVKATYTISNDKLDVWGSKTAYTALQYGIPELKMKSGTLYFRVLDKEDREKVLNEYDLIEQKDDCLIFDTHSDAGKCTVPKVVQANE